jgi:bifunctional UDP-N-acetylglucosamine pyrophosphorylase/glucosamine-1-phosphate N-acetyltransferase
LTAAAHLAPHRTVVVVRHERDTVANHVRAFNPSIVIADQEEIPGTGRAVQCALAALEFDPHEVGPIVVLSADCPLVDGGILTGMVAAHSAEGSAVTVLTAHVADPSGYGRIVKDPVTGDVVAIVEDKDADPSTKLITEINSSMYAFDAATLQAALSTLDRNNAQGQVLLTDVISSAHAAGKVSRAYIVTDPWVIEGVNNRLQLARIGQELNRRHVEAAMYQGVTIVDPATTWIDVGVTLARDVTLMPGTHLKPGTSVGEGATIGPDSTLENTVVGAGAILNRVHAVGAIVGPGALVGPWTHLRPGTVLAARAKAGSFVEIKASDIGEGAKVPHLSYVGDATVGEGANIGAATIFANYDGVTKARTTVGRHAKIGSDTILVAPVTVGDGAYTGAGSVIREDVPPGALAVNDTHQRTIPGWVARRRPGTTASNASHVDGSPPDATGLNGSPLHATQRDASPSSTTSTQPPTSPRNPAGPQYQ